MGELSDSMISVKEDDEKWGYEKVYYDNLLKTTMSDRVIPCKFDEAYNFENGLAMVKSGDAYFINKKGEYVKPVKEVADEEITNNTGEQTESISIDYINLRGERIIRGKPGNLSGLFLNGAALVQMDGKWGYMNKQGTIIIPCRYDSAGSFNEGLATVKQNNKWGFIYQDGDTLTSCRFDYAYNFHNGIAIIKMNGKYGYIDKTGLILIPCQFDMAYTFKDSVAIIRNGDQFGFINKAGRLVIPAEYDDAFDFHEGLAAVQRGGLWGYINKSGVVVIPFRYENAGRFAEGFAPVMKNGKYGYIDIAGNTIVPYVYKFAYPFVNGKAIAGEENEEIVVLNTKGNEVFAAQLRSLFYEDLAIVVNDKGKLGFMNQNGQTVIACQYDDAMIFREGLAAVAINKKWGFINKQGTVVIPLQFDAALVFNEGIGIIANIKID